MNELVTKEHDELLKKLAWEVSKNVIDHHKNVYAKVFNIAPTTFPISLRNSIYNQIASAMKCGNDLEIAKWIRDSESHRKEMNRIKRSYKKSSLTTPQGNERE